MTEFEHSAERQPLVEKITHGDAVVYVTTIKKNSLVNTLPNKDQQLAALNEMTKKAKLAKESVIGTAIISTATDDEWLVNKMQYTLMLIGASPVTQPRTEMPKNIKKSYVTTKTPEAYIGSVLLVPAWKDMYKGSLSKAELLPVAYFADQAIQSLGKNINVSVNMPNLGMWTTHLIATKNSGEISTKNPALSSGIKPHGSLGLR